MKFKHTNAWRARYDKYEFKDKNGITYITPADGAKPKPHNLMKESEKLVIDFLNVGLMMMRRTPEAEVKNAVLEFVNNYGLLGFITALPTTAKFITYEKVYFPTNHFIKDESMETSDYLDIFFPFEKLDFTKFGQESTWHITSEAGEDRTVLALAFTFSNEPEAVLMSFMPEYAERYDWICRQMKDLAFSLTASFLYYNDYDELDEDERDLYRRGMAAFGGITPTYRIVLEERPTIIWEFHSLMSCVQTMFSFMLTDENSTIRICKNCLKAFIANRHNKSFCSSECRNGYKSEREN